MQTLWEREGILDRQAHIRHAQLSLHRSIGKLHGTMHDALRMNQHLYLLGRNAKEPLCFCHLKPLVHQRSRVDGNLGTHIPGRMLEELLYLVIALAHQTLEDGTVLAIHRKDRHMVFLGKIADQLTSHHQGLLVGKTDLLASLDGMDGWFQTGKTYHGCKHHINRLCLHDIAERLGTGIDLDIRFITEQILQLVVMRLIGNHYSSRMELMRLLGKLLHPVIGGKAIYLVKVAVLLDDIQRLCANTSRRTENTYLLFHFI